MPCLFCFLFLRKHVLDCCLALSASLIPPLTRVNTDCSNRVCVYVCGRVWGGSSGQAVTSLRTQMLLVKFFCMMCERGSFLGMWLTCGGQGDMLQTHWLFHTHFLRSEVTTPPRSSSRKTFHILNACNDFLEYGLTGLRNELRECHPRCPQAQVTTCDLRIHIEPQELRNKQYNRLLFFFFLSFLPVLSDFPSRVFPPPGHARTPVENVEIMLHLQLDCPLSCERLPLCMGSKPPSTCNYWLRVICSFMKRLSWRIVLRRNSGQFFFHIRSS